LQILRARKTLRELESHFVCVSCAHGFARRFTAQRLTRNQVVGYGVDATLGVTCTQSNWGRFEARVELLFEDARTGERFVIARPVLAAIGNVEEHRALQPISPYVVPKRPREQRQVTEIEGGVVSWSPKPRCRQRCFNYCQMPPFETSIPWKSRIPFYYIPGDLFAFLNKRQPNMVVETGRKFLPQQLTPGTYTQMFQVLLWCEEFKISYASPVNTSRHCRIDVYIGEISRSSTFRMPGSNIGGVSICVCSHLS